MAKIVIIGAGLTGISAAYHLEQKGFNDYAIFERDNTIGGLCGTIAQDGFTFDFTGHYLHASDPYFRSMIEQLVGMENLNTVIRKSFIYSHDTYTRYPFQVNLFGLSDQVIAECIEGFVLRNRSRKKPQTFPEWVLQNFGAGFGKQFFFPFQRKIFGHPLEKITASWTGRFVPQTSLQQIVKGSMQDIDDTLIGYNASFLYPKKGGILFWVQKIADQLTQPIHTNFCVSAIDLKTKTVSFTNGHVEPFEQLISTMPLDKLLSSLQEKSSTSLATAADKLLCNKVINFNLGVNRPQLSEKHWIYFPEKHYPFYRMGFPSNCSQFMTPPGCSSLYGEFSHVNKSKTWVTSTLKASLDATKKLFNIADSEILMQKIIPISHAYVIYDTWREKNLPKIHNRLAQESVHSVGRYGEWKYSSMQEAVLDGKKIAEQLIVVPARHAPETEFVISKQKKEKVREL
ncbi:MAG: FAD-dependent oxidoreductase [Candidatus Dependentiae bacterium]|nr:FAD-dependent oxidoreductase [Candidatus Dependentiae bacterium]